MSSPPRLAAIKEGTSFWDSPSVFGRADDPENVENDDTRSPGRNGRLPQSVPPKPTFSSLSGSHPSNIPCIPPSLGCSKNSRLAGDGKPSPLSPSRKGNATAQKKGASSPDVFSKLTSGADHFSVTPTILYGGTKECREAAPGSHNNYYSLKSPHWHGEVMINPFSPIPSSYLNPSSSQSSDLELSFELLPKIKRARHTDHDPAISLTQDSNQSTAISWKDQLEEKFSPSGAKSSDILLPSPPKGQRKRKATTQPPAVGMERKKRAKRGRYLDDFEEVCHLGSGSFGSVNAVLSRLDGVTYAIKSVGPSTIKSISKNGRDGHSFYGGRATKSIECPIPPTPRRGVAKNPLCTEFGSGSRHCLLREVFALAALCNEQDLRNYHIVRYYGCWLEDDGTLYIQMEMCSSTLRNEMDNSATFDMWQKFKVLKEMLSALELVHQRGIAHLDIKPENIFTKNGSYKLGDFGLASGVSAQSDEEGDSRYLAREMLDKPIDLTKCDIFSLGATLYECCLGGRSLPGCGQEWQDIRDGKLLHLPDTCPSFYRILREMMHPDPKKRPSANEILSRPELDGGNAFLHSPSHRKTMKRSLSW